VVTVRPMKRAEFTYVMSQPHTHYAEGMARAEALSAEEAQRIADAQIAAILTDGFDTEGHHFYSVDADGDFAGFAWFQIKEEKGAKMALGYNIHIRPEFRRRGLAKCIFEYLTPRLKEMGVKYIAFHVYADNHHAIALYEQFDFRMTNVIMRRELT